MILIIGERGIRLPALGSCLGLPGRLRVASASMRCFFSTQGSRLNFLQQHFGSNPSFDFLIIL